MKFHPSSFALADFASRANGQPEQIRDHLATCAKCRHLLGMINYCAPEEAWKRFQAARKKAKG